MTYDFEIRLEGANSPKGEIRFADLHAIADSLQELSLRLARANAQQPGRGRSKRTVEELSELRLVGIREGSTLLQVSQGPSDQLDLDLEDSRRQAADFWEVVGAIAADTRPDALPDLVAESAGKVVAALHSAAKSVKFRRQDGAELTVNAAALTRDTWVPARGTVRGDVMSLSGVLQAVDLDNGHFRILDDVGHRIPLNHVSDALTAARYIGTRVTASGEAILGADGRFKHLEAPTVEPTPHPTEWTPGAIADLAEELAKPGPVIGEGVELTDEEWADFLAYMKS
jgi:hypothetical protein